MKRIIVLLGLLLLLFLMIACSLLAASTPQIITEVVTATSLLSTDTPLPPTETIIASTTALPTVLSTLSPTTIPCNWAEFVSDVTYPDNTVVKAGETFVKTWRLKNVGTCSWTAEYDVVYTSGDKMGATDMIQLTTGVISPGGTVDVSVTFTAPDQSGTYLCYFKLMGNNNETFGIGPNADGDFWVQIKSEKSIATVIQPSIPSLTRNLKLMNPYMEGNDVKALQNRLLVLGYDLGIADGLFGKKTDTAVRAFQGDNGLIVDGVVGSQTWAKLFE